MIAIIDYGMGNLASVSKAFEFLGAKARVTADPKVLRKAKTLVFPGVGAFGEAMKELKKRRLLDPIIGSIRDGKPFLGLCLGLQLLFESSEESPAVKGLGVLPGRVRKLPRRRGLKIPHMGWNQIQKVRGSEFGDRSREFGDRRSVILPTPNTGLRTKSLLEGIPDGAFMYFVHSFYADPEDGQRVVSMTEYGHRFPSVIWNGDRLWATQFHPEKSQKWGLKLLRNFLEC